MLLAAIAGIGALASAVGGAIASSRVNNKARELIEKQRQDNRNWYNARRAEEYTQRTDAQNVIDKQRQLLEERYKAARATNAVGGGSDESIALQQAAANDSLAQTMSNIASNASAYKENLEREYKAKDDALNQQQAQSFQQQGQASAQAAGQAVNAGVNLLGNSIVNGDTSSAPNTPAAANPAQVARQQIIASDSAAMNQSALDATIKANALSNPIKKIN